MATAKEFDELFGQFLIEQDSEKKKKILEKMRQNVLERNGKNDVFRTLQTNKTIYILKAEHPELKNVSFDLEEIKKQKQRENLNNKERERELSKNEYSKSHPYPDSNNPIQK
jgi:hypothetical protein